MKFGFLVVAAGCYAPSPVVGVPCSDDFACPAGQTCDRGAVPPVCRGGEAAVDARAGDAPSGRWSAPQRVREPAGPEDDPTLTDDMLELFYNRDDKEVWRMRRTSTAEPWGPAQRVNALGTATSPELTGDGRTMYIASNRNGTVGLFDLWVSTRVDPDATWTQPARVIELSSVLDETNATPTRDDRALVFARKVSDERSYEVFVVERLPAVELWGFPVPLVELGSTAADGDPMLSADRLAIYFYSQRRGGGDLYVATRASTGEAFGAPQAIDELNLPNAVEQDPWISPDGRTLYFASDRGGEMAIYRSTR